MCPRPTRRGSKANCPRSWRRASKSVSRGSFVEAEFDSTVRNGTGTVIGGIREGNRLPSVPKFQISLNATYSYQLNESTDGYFTASFQHVGSRFTQASERPGSAARRFEPPSAAASGSAYLCYSRDTT